MPARYSRFAARWRSIPHFFRRRRKLVSPKREAYALWKGDQDAIHRAWHEIMDTMREENPELAIDRIEAERAMKKASANALVAAEEAHVHYVQRENANFVKRVKPYAAEKAMDLLEIPQEGQGKRTREIVVSLISSNVFSFIAPSLARETALRRDAAMHELFPILGKRTYAFLNDYHRIFHQILKYVPRNAPAP